MNPTDFGRGRFGCGRRAQRGQALVYGIFFLIGGLASLFFIFNTGQLTREKTKLVNTADAVAYSAGVMHARTLNFEAYTNRAMMANTVAIAQLVSLSSWVQYADNVGTWGFMAGQTYKYPLFTAGYYAAVYEGNYLQNYLNDSSSGTSVLEGLSDASDTIIKMLQGAQAVAHAGMILPGGARDQVMQQVADANYTGDGAIVVDAIWLSPTAYSSFVSSYSDDERTRFKEVVQVAVDKDNFVKKRSWDMPALYADCVGATPRVDWLDRRGGTSMVGFDQWQAMDTLSQKRWVPSNKTDIFCRAIAEDPQGWGETVAADNATMDTDITHYDYSLPVNPSPTALAMATSTSWGYSGLPTFYDLSEDARKEDDPTLKFAFRLKRDKNQTVTSEGRSGIINTPRLNTYTAKTAGGSEFVAVSASEAYFYRDGAAKDNSYGSSLGKPREIGSLFNPFWQTRLIAAPDKVRNAQLLQGVVMP